VQRALQLAIGSHGQVVGVMAEAGTGESRLFYEFKATSPPTCKVLEAYSVSHGKASAWLPVLELLRTYFDVEDSDDAAARRAKVRAALTALDAALEDTLPYFFGVLGITEGRIRSPRWTRRSGAKGRSTQSSALSCARASSKYRDDGTHELEHACDNTAALRKSRLFAALGVFSRHRRYR
jgi:hypothetical protein